MRPFNVERNSAAPIDDEEAVNLIVKEPVEGPLKNVKVDNDASNVNYKRFYEFTICFVGLIASYVTWGVMQELIMDTKFNPSPRVPSGMFPSCMLFALLLIIIDIIFT